MGSTNPDTRRASSAHNRLDAAVDAMSECSFPASDPPAVWTWDAAAAAERQSPDVRSAEAKAEGSSSSSS